jgi:DNA-binding NarL/FixJ family response regulator
MSTRFAFNVMGMLDALYAIQQPSDSWVAGVLDAAARFLSHDASAGVVRYDISQGQLGPTFVASTGVSEEWRQVGIEMHRDPQMVSDIARGYASVVSAGAREMLLGSAIGFEGYRATMQACGVGDQWVINGRTDSGKSAALYLFGRSELQFTATQRQMLTALAAHVGSAYRLHRSVSQQGSALRVEAMIGPHGQLEHATAATQGLAARRRLAEAVSLRIWARERAPSEAPEKALRALKALVNATWTLVDWADADGKRYVLACRNLATEQKTARFSRRERQVAMLAKEGHSNKVIAYELGLAHSTVRVLLARAAVKLGVESRSELVRDLELPSSDPRVYEQT